MNIFLVELVLCASAYGSPLFVGLLSLGVLGVQDSLKEGHVYEKHKTANHEQDQLAMNLDSQLLNSGNDYGNDNVETHNRLLLMSRDGSTQQAVEAIYDNDWSGTCNVIHYLFGNLTVHEELDREEFDSSGQARYYNAIDAAAQNGNLALVETAASLHNICPSDE